MTDPTEPPTPAARQLRLSIFRLPIEADPGNAEVGIGQRGLPQADVKRRFWGTLAKRLDLTGRGSLVRERPYGTGHDELMAASEARLERLFEQLSNRGDMQVLLGDGEIKPSQLHRQVALEIEEVTPQLFLRNIPRVERHADVRRLDYQYVVWRDDQREMIELARRPYLEPVDFLKQLSSHALEELKAEAFERVYGLDWSTDLHGLKHGPVRLPAFGFSERKTIPIEELKDEPAPAGRETSSQRHFRTLKELGKRFDASKD